MFIVLCCFLILFPFLLLSSWFDLFYSSVFLFLLWIFMILVFVDAMDLQWTCLSHCHLFYMDNFGSMQTIHLPIHTLWNWWQILLLCCVSTNKFCGYSYSYWFLSFTLNATVKSDFKPLLWIIIFCVGLYTIFTFSSEIYSFYMLSCWCLPSFCFHLKNSLYPFS